MKCRSVVLIGMLLLVVALVACSSSSSQSSVVTVTGTDIDLSQDFADSVSAFNEQKVAVHSMYGIFEQYYVDENGNLMKKQIDDSYDFMVYGEDQPLPKQAVYYSIADEENNPDKEILMQKTFAFREMFEYQSFEGIHNGSALKDVDALGYTKCSAFFEYKNECRAALYVDDKRVDLSDYKDKFEDWRNSFEQNGLRGSLEKEFPELQYSSFSLGFLLSDRARVCSDYDELVALCEEMHYPLEESIIMSYALQYAGEKLAAGKIDSFSIIRYEDMPDYGMIMIYDEFYFEK